MSNQNNTNPLMKPFSEVPLLRGYDDLFYPREKIRKALRRMKSIDAVRKFAASKGLDEETMIAEYNDIHNNTMSFEEAYEAYFSQTEELERYTKNEIAKDFMMRVHIRYYGTICKTEFIKQMKKRKQPYMNSFVHTLDMRLRRHMTKEEDTEEASD